MPSRVLHESLDVFDEGLIDRRPRFRSCKHFDEHGQQSGLSVGRTGNSVNTVLSRKVKSNKRREEGAGKGSEISVEQFGRIEKKDTEKATKMEEKEKKLDFDWQAEQDFEKKIEMDQSPKEWKEEKIMIEEKENSKEEEGNKWFMKKEAVDMKNESGKCGPRRKKKIQVITEKEQLKMAEYDRCTSDMKKEEKVYKIIRSFIVDDESANVKKEKIHERKTDSMGFAEQHVTEIQSKNEAEDKDDNNGDNVKTTANLKDRERIQEIQKLIQHNKRLARAKDKAYQREMRENINYLLQEQQKQQAKVNYLLQEQQKQRARYDMCY